MASVNPSRIYEDYDPPSDLVTEEGSDTILIYLPGYRKEQLRVQLTTSRILKISGERQIDSNKWRRFNKEFRVPSNCDVKEITAKYEGGILYIRQPKLTTPAAQGAAEQPADKGKTSAVRPSPQQQAPDLPQRQPQQAPDLPPHQPQQAPNLPPHQPQVFDLPPRQPQQVPDLSQPQAKLLTPMQRLSQPLPQPSLEAPLPEPQGGLEKKTGIKDSHKDTVRKEKADEGKDKCEFKARPTRAGGRAGLYRELSKSGNCKRLVVSVLLVLGIGFYINYTFNTFLGDSGYDKEL